MKVRLIIILDEPLCQEEDEDGLLGEEDILDIDRAELLLGQDIGNICT